LGVDGVEFAVDDEFNVDEELAVDDELWDDGEFAIDEELGLTMNSPLTMNCGMTKNWVGHELPHRMVVACQHVHVPLLIFNSLRWSAPSWVALSIAALITFSSGALGSGVAIVTSHFLLSFPSLSSRILNLDIITFHPNYLFTGWVSSQIVFRSEHSLIFSHFDSVLSSSQIL
jgi:hypothetical protein